MREIRPYRCWLRFNEAAGIPRGRLPHRLALLSRRQFSFNEAAGIPRGRLEGLRLDHRLCQGASMRPRVFPAEDKKAKDDEYPEKMQKLQ